MAYMEGRRTEKSKKQKAKGLLITWTINQSSPLLKAKKLLAGADKRMNVVCPFEKWRGPRKSGRRLEKKGVIILVCPFDQKVGAKQNILTSKNKRDWLLIAPNLSPAVIVIVIFSLLYIFASSSRDQYHRQQQLYFGKDQTTRAQVDCYVANFWSFLEQMATHIEAKTQFIIRPHKHPYPNTAYSVKFHKSLPRKKKKPLLKSIWICNHNVELSKFVMLDLMFQFVLISPVH